MSLGDSSDFRTDESDEDDEDEERLRVVEDDDVANYLELIHLHNNLKYYDHIYINNVMMDKEYMENEPGPIFDRHILDTEWDLIQDILYNIFEDISSEDSSMTSSSRSHGSWFSFDSEDSEVLDLEHLVELYEDILDASS